MARRECPLHMSERWDNQLAHSISTACIRSRDNCGGNSFSDNQSVPLHPVEHGFALGELDGLGGFLHPEIGGCADGREQ